ncbi:MAG: molybdopterin-dependent oxidoreductase [Acidimicrobiales bacterium]
METVVGACALDCPDACSWVVTVDEGVPIKLRGNRDHPHTRKGLCVKVNSYLAYTKHPDRLLHPMRRVGAKGEGRFEQITWDQALEEIATRLKGVADEFGSEAIWPYRGTGTMGYIQGIGGAGKRLFHALGASRHDPSICAAAANSGLAYTSGRGSSMDPLDVVRAGVVLVWGSNTVSTNQHYWHFIREAQRAGAEVVVIDPVTTRTAQRADRHLAIRPGTDGALALGLMAHLVKTEMIDPAVSNTVGWDEFRDQVLAEWSPARAALECDIAVTEIVELGELIAKHGPLAIRLGMGMQRHEAGGQAARVISCLPMLTGDYTRLGGGLCYSTGPLYGINDQKLNRPDLSPIETRELAMTRLGEGLLELDDPPVKALFVIAANPMASNPDQNRIRRGLSREDLFCVVIDNFATDTVDYADIVLPSTMQTEHLDIHDSVSHLFLNFNNPVAEPAGECLSHSEIFRRLARTMNLDEPALFASDIELVKAALDSEHPAMAGIDLEELRSSGFVRLGYPEPFLRYREAFDTPSGRFEFASRAAETAGHGLLPHYVAPREATQPRAATSNTGSGSLALIAGANHFMMNSMFANSSDHAKAGPPVIALHPDDGAARDLTSGMTVRVHNSRGEFHASLQISKDVRIGVATMSKGHWPKLCGGSSINATTLEADADMARGATFHDNQVYISATAEQIDDIEHAEATR